MAGALAALGLVVLHADVRSLYEGLLHGAALAVLIVSLVAGSVTMVLVHGRRFEAARYGGALAVAAVIAAWAVARYPTLLPGLTVDQAAAPHDTLVTLVVAVVAGAVILFPSLALLFTLTLRGRLGEHRAAAGETTVGSTLAAPARQGLMARVSIALLIAGVGLLNAATAAWAHAAGVVSLLAFVIVAFAAIVPGALAEDR